LIVTFERLVFFAPSSSTGWERWNRKKHSKNNPDNQRFLQSRL